LALEVGGAPLVVGLEGGGALWGWGGGVGEGLEGLGEEEAFDGLGEGVGIEVGVGEELLEELGDVGEVEGWWSGGGGRRGGVLCGWLWMAVCHAVGRMGWEGEVGECSGSGDFLGKEPHPCPLLKGEGIIRFPSPRPSP